VAVGHKLSIGDINHTFFLQTLITLLLFFFGRVITLLLLCISTSKYMVMD
jgi:hypothetical protein